MSSLCAPRQASERRTLLASHQQVPPPNDKVLAVRKFLRSIKASEFYSPWWLFLLNPWIRAPYVSHNPFNR